MIVDYNSYHETTGNAYAGNKSLTFLQVELPPRSVPESALRFEMSSSYSKGAATIHYAHLKQHPSTFKVALNVKIEDLNLSKEESEIFIALVGPRYNQGKKECRITCDRFPNRIENKKYATIILERVVAESKRIRECELLEKSDPEAFQTIVANTVKDENYFDLDPDAEWRNIREEKEENLRLLIKKLESLGGQ